MSIPTGLKRWLTCLLLASMTLIHSRADAPAHAAPTSFPVAIRVDAARPLGDLNPIWRMFGADEPNYAYMPNGRKLLGDLGALKPGDVFFRTHNLLCTGDGTPALKWGSTGVYREDADGRPVYDWGILDKIFDTYLTNGVKPYAEIGFMPEALSTHPEPYQHRWSPESGYWDIATGWAYPPTDYSKWAGLVESWVNHSVARYGRAEVERWYWEVWNEPNISYWKGSREDFFKLHDYAIEAVRRVLPTARVGGPDCAGGPGGSFLQGFLEHCLRGTNYANGKVGTPLDFIAFHAKGSPLYTNGYVRMGIASELRNINDAFGVIARFPELRRTPIVIGECDPEGCAACQGDQLGYRNGTMYSSYTAASFGRFQEMADRHGVNLDAALTWAFTFEGYPPFAGFRQLASYGINHPVLNVFRMFSRMNGQRVAVQSDAAVPLDAIIRSGVRQSPDVSALAALGTNQLTVLVWHYHDDDLPGPSANVSLALAGLPAEAKSATLTHYRIDAEHSNAFAVWRRLGSPQEPTAGQFAQLERASQLTTLGVPEKISVGDGSAELAFALPRQAVSLLVLSW
jgi:xylan 1,4-beta-xylosidase